MIGLSQVLRSDGQLNAAEKAVSRATDLLPEKGQEPNVSQSHRFLGDIYHDKGERERALHHYQVALGISSPFNWQDHLFWIHMSLALLFLDEDSFDDATAHIEQVKSCAVENRYGLGRVMELQAQLWYRQGRLEAAWSEVLLALETFEKLGASKDVERCRDILLWDIEDAVEKQLELGEVRS